MKRIALAMMLCATIALCASGARAQIPIQANMDGTQEVPPNASPGTGSLNGTLTGGPGSFVFTYSGSFSGLLFPVNAQPAGGHIHEAPPGVNGGIVHPFDNLDSGVTAGNFSGVWRFDDASNPLTDALASAMLAGNLYANIHTSGFQGGEIRGQLVPEPASLGLLLSGTMLLLRRRRG